MLSKHFQLGADKSTLCSITCHEIIHKSETGGMLALINLKTDIDFTVFLIFPIYMIKLATKK